MPGTYSMLCGFQISCKPYLILHLYLQTLIAICYTMKHVEGNGDWSLFCPNEVLGMADVHSAEFEALYKRYKKEGGWFLPKSCGMRFLSWCIRTMPTVSFYLFSFAQQM